jgi:hypothetical protein
MKTTNKISSFISGVVIALTITLFLPSAANANWGNYNHGSKTHGSKNYSSSCNTDSHGSKAHGSKAHGSKNHGSKAHGSKNHGSKAHGSHGSNCSTSKYNKYKALAAKYLKAYYRCYNYRYYRYYVYYMKKANACKPKPAADNCAKYKNLADKYLAAYNRCGYYCYYRYYQYYTNLYNKCEANTHQVGKVCGQVFEDSNDNGSYDNSDKPLANVSVKITDAKGKIQTVKTNAKGYYCASNVAVGTASVDIDENTLPANPTQVVGTDPTDVDVKANTKNQEERNGYTFPIPTGKVCGLVFEDTNGNGVQDAGEPAYAGAKVTIIDANGDTHTATTGTDGKYCKDDIAEGSAEVTVEVSSLPANANITTENPTSINVKANTNNQAGKDGFTVPTPTGKLCGYVFLDVDGQEQPIENVTVNVLDAEGNAQDVTTDANGKYCADGVAEGSATVDIDDNTLPANAEYASGNGDPSDHNVIANKENSAGKDVYVVPSPVGNLCGKVVVDGNGQAGVTLNITDVNGDITPIITDTNGTWCANDLPEGDATVDVVESTLPSGVERVLGTDNDTYTVVAGDQVDAGIDGFIIPDPVGTLFGHIYEDVNSNRAFDNGDTGLAGVTVKITAIDGTVYMITTDENGLWKQADLPEGAATVEVIEDTLPDGFKYVYGDNPTTASVLANNETDAGMDGYTIHRISSIYGWVKKDTNGNGTYDSTDEGIPGVSVIITDANGDQHTLITDETGLWFKVNLPGGTTIVDIDDTTIPNGLARVYGTDPKTTTIVEGPGSTAAGIVGYGTPAPFNP